MPTLKCAYLVAWDLQNTPKESGVLDSSHAYTAAEFPHVGKFLPAMV